MFTILITVSAGFIGELGEYSKQIFINTVHTAVA